MRIKKYNDFNLTDSMVEYFINEFNIQILVESNDSTDSMLKKIVSDLNLNFRLVATFGFGIGAFLPIVTQLMKNMDLSSVDLTKETLVLLTLTAISIIFIEEKKPKNSEEEAQLIKDSKSMLEELRMKGIGDGIVKKLINCLKSTKSIFKIIGKHLGAVVGGFMDMFAYSAIMLPIMTTLSSVINKFDLNLDTMPQNFLMLTAGVGTIVAKHGIAYILNKLKGKLKISDKIEKEIESEIETPTITKITRFGDGDSNQSGELIKEQ
jgi:hypothetical protein